MVSYESFLAGFGLQVSLIQDLIKPKTPFSKMFCVFCIHLTAYQLHSAFRGRSLLQLPYKSHKMCSCNNCNYGSMYFVNFTVRFHLPTKFLQDIKSNIKNAAVVLPACNGEGDKIDFSSWHGVPMLLSSTCWLTAVQDYSRFISHDQDSNNSK